MMCKEASADTGALGFSSVRSSVFINLSNLSIVHQLNFEGSKMFSVITDNLVDIFFLMAVAVILYIYKTRGFGRSRFRKPSNTYFWVQIIILAILGPVAYILSQQ